MYYGRLENSQLVPKVFFSRSAGCFASAAVEVNKNGLTSQMNKK